jgi:ribokinase
MIQPKIFVVGASNYDLIAYVNRLPQSGETVLGYDFKMGCGGKGANQAVAAAKLGASVTIVTKLGRDIFGEKTFENYKNLNIATDYISFTDKAASGVAPIWVDKFANNSIIVVSGANDLMSAEEIEAARLAIAESNILICQNEIPFAVTKKALQVAKEENVITMFNPAPVPTKSISKSFFSLIDILCANEIEASVLGKKSICTVKDALFVGKSLLRKGVKIVLITLGKQGCVLVSADVCEHFPVMLKINAVDTTGAGDCFIGVFAYFYAKTQNLKLSVQKAQYVAGLSVQKHGTQSSYPYEYELSKEFF